jgi:DivIVA domain-containing protein
VLDSAAPSASRVVDGDEDLVPGVGEILRRIRRAAISTGRAWTTGASIEGGFEVTEGVLCCGTVRPIEAKEPSAKAPGRARTRSRVPDAEIAELRDVSFSTAMRGYDRDAVDQYVNRVNRVLAELQITAAPESAIRHALEQVTDETQGLLERAHETADEITRRSRSQADDRIQAATHEAQELHDASEQEARELRDAAAHEAREVREAAAKEAREVREAAQREAREIREAAETRVRELEDDARAIMDERARLIGELRELLLRLGEFADAAAARYPSPPPAAPDPDTPT